MNFYTGIKSILLFNAILKLIEPFIEPFPYSLERKQTD